MTKNRVGNRKTVPSGQSKKKKAKRKSTKYYDYNLLAAVIILLCFGLVMLYSASAYESVTKFHNDLFYFGKQAVISVAAIGLALLVSLIDYHWYMKLSGYLYILGFLLMLLVLSPLGVEAYGARRWLKLGVQFQPSEVAKIGVILFLPYVILKMGKKIQTLKGEMFILFLGALQAVAAWKFTDNLSTAIIIFLIACVILYLADPKSTWMVVAAGIFAAIGIVAIFWLKDHLYILETENGFRLNRIYEWLQGGSYQVLQGLYAIGSGGILGKGLGNSTQKINTIPEAQNDMIFSIICEELGIFGALLLLLMFGYLLYRLFFIAQNAPDLYGSLVVSGIFGHIAIQVILNLLVVMNVIPTTGITLPFVSYGGTSVLFLMTEIGIALGVARRITFRNDEIQESSEKESAKNVLTNS
ncbi:MAG: FtsW/RodA/SpoVE family cell cycle protein [Fusicatenibacter sp.]|nr:FtsW/RodA/SpoVE family cell cycle protein [Fusicatenibacter sp.]